MTMSVRDSKRRQRGKEEMAKSDPSNDVADDVIKDIVKGRTDDQERIQQKVFAKWINSRFAKANSPSRVDDLFQDFRTGVLLAALVELVTGVKVPVEKGRTRFACASNISSALEVLQNEIKLVSVSTEDIEEGNSKLTLSLTWAIIQHYYVKRLGSTVSDLRISNLEKTLLCWCQLATKGYAHVDVKNLHSSFIDGLAFNAVIHRYREDLFEYSDLLSNTAEVNLRHAFDLAAQHLDVPRLLEPEDLQQNYVDQKSIVIYLLCLLEALPHETMEINAVTSVSQLESNSAGGDADSGRTYHSSAEAVLAWMLAAEEKLDRNELSESLEEATQLWNDHEGLMLEISMQQNAVQKVLNHGAKLLQSGKSRSKQSNDIENSLTVLTERWENLRSKATERSNLLQRIVSVLQQEHLSDVNTWLLDTEKRVTSLKANTTSIESMDAQLRELSKLQDDLEKQLVIMNKLLHVLIVGDASENEVLESNLLRFRQRWDELCHWTESQWEFVQRIRNTYDDFSKLCAACGEWIAGRIELLHSLPRMADERLQWVQRNLDMLQELHDQMADHQESIQDLQEKSEVLLSYFTPQTSIGMQIRHREEKISADWNILVDLLEVLTADVNLPFDKADELRSSKVRQSKRYSDNVDATIFAQSSEETEPKTKKPRQEEEDEGVLDNCDALIEWLREKRHQLEEGLSSRDQSTIEEVRAKEAEYKSLRMLAEDVISEKRTMNVPFEEVENKLNELAAAWSRIAWNMDVEKDAQMKDDEMSLNRNLEVLKDVLISCQSSVERLSTDKDPPSSRIDQDLNDCKDRLHLMEINAERMKETALLVDRVSTVDSSWSEFAKRWQVIKQQLVDVEKRLSELKEDGPLRAFLAETEALLSWTNEVHQSLMEEAPLRPTYLDRMEERLQHYHNVQSAVTQYQPKLEVANCPPKQLVDKLSGSGYQMSLLDLNAKWKDILQYLQHNTEEVTKWIENLRDFQVDVQGLRQWMADVNSFLDVDTETVDDPQALAALQEQFQGLEEDIKALSPTTDKLLEAGRLFLRSDHQDFVEDMRRILQDVEEQWNSTCGRASRQMQSVPVRIADTERNVFGDEKALGKLASFTARVDVALDEMSNINTFSDLQGRSHRIKDTIKMGESYLAPANGKTLTDTELALVNQRLEKLRSLNAELDRHQQMWNELSGHLKEAEDWVVVAEEKASDVDASSSDSQRRKQLQDLTSYMGAQDSDKYVAIADLAEQFTAAGVLVPLVKTEVDKMRQRLSNLSKRVSELQQINASDGTDSRASEVYSTDLVGHSTLFDSLEPVNQLLSELQKTLPSMELKQFDSVTIKSQLEDCVMLYKKLSEIKAEVELLIKQGREMVESDPSKAEHETLSRQLDSMKTQYNQLGAQVTAAKAELDNGFKQVKRAEKELDAFRTAMDEMEAALAELDKISTQQEYEAAVDDVKLAAKEREEVVNNLRNSHQQMRELAMKRDVPGFELKYSAQMQRWTKIQSQLRCAKFTEKAKTPKAMAVARDAFFNDMKTVQVVTVTTTTRQENNSELAVAAVNKAKLDLRQEDKHRSQQHKHSKILSPHLKMFAESVSKNTADDGEVEKLLDATVQLDHQFQQLYTASDRLQGRMDEVLDRPLSLKELNVTTQSLEEMSHDLALCEVNKQKLAGDLDRLKNDSRAMSESVSLDMMEQEVDQRMTELRQRMTEIRKLVENLQSFYKVLEDILMVWLPKAEAVSAELLDSLKKGSLDNERYMRLVEERDSRITQFDTAVQAANAVLHRKEKGPVRVTVKRDLANLSLTWNNLNTAINGIKDGQTADGLDVESYRASLLEAEKWVMRKKDELMTMRPSGDRAFLTKLQDYHHLFRAQLEREKPSIDSLLARGQTLQQQQQQQQHLLTTDPKGTVHGRNTMAELSDKVKSLSASWQSLFQQSDALQVETEAVTEELDRLLKLCDTVREKLDELHADCNKWELPDDVNIDDLPKKIEESKKVKSKVDVQAAKLEELNSLAARIQRTHSGLSEEVVRSVAQLNEHKQELCDKVDNRLGKLVSATQDVTSSENQHFLATSVDDPWERRVGPNRTPYYINHTEQRSQWDHPRMTDLMSALLEVNNIRFSAYRTATKLRLMQKKLHLDLLPLNTASDIFDKCGLRAQNDTTLDCAQAVTCLMAIYSHIDAQYPNRINFSLSIDVCLNWLLNCHDPERTGRISVLTFKVSIVILCHGDLNAKYRYLFRLISDANGFADQKRIGQLLYSCIHVPRFLGEVAAFGGTDPQPSIDSCFKFSSNGFNIQAKEFLAWLNREPQAVVWLSVLHRLIAAEGSRHPAKCNFCRQFPIIGLRYRCLKCFNYDLCQNCFFTGKASKNHKISHPMQEYCFPATSGEDMRDFKRVLKNKLRSRESLTGSTKSLGYLPVQATTPARASADYDKSATLTSLNVKGSIGSNDAADFTQTRIIEFEGSRGASSPEAEEEHNLITRYCNTLNGAHDFTQTPVQILRAVEREEKEEMEDYLRQLQDDHDRLIVELESVKQLHDDLPASNLVAEASMLRDDKGRLEARMKVLQDHNQQLDSQLQRIKHLLAETPERVPASPVPSNYSNGRTTPADNLHMKGSSSVTNGSSPLPTKKSARHDSYSVGQLFHAAGSLNVAVGSLVNVMNEEEQAAINKSSALH